METKPNFNTKILQDVKPMSVLHVTKPYTQSFNENDEHPPSPSQASPIVYAVVASAIASVGGILFGYDIGIISGALLLLKKEFNLTDFEQEMVVSAVLMGSLFCALFGGSIVDKFGRKNAIIISGVLFIAGAVVLAFSINYAMLLIGRFVVGLAIAMSVTAECTYISEISPPKRRGMLVSLNEVGITVGFLLAYLLNYLLVSCPNGWQYMFAAAIIPALIQIIGISFMPRSPHYLIIKGEIDEAKRVLNLLRQTNNVDEEICAIHATMAEKKDRKYSDLLRSEGNVRGRLLLGMSLVFFQQFSGHANVLYYAPTVFQHFGYCSDSSATLVTVGLGIVKVVSTTVTVLTVDKFGRRRLLLIGCLMMALSITVLGVTSVTTSDNAFCPNINHTMKSNMLPFNDSKLDEDFTNELNMTTFQAGLNRTIWTNGMASNTKAKLDYLSEDKSSTVLARYVSIISLMAFVCAYGISYGPVTWLVLSEIFPTGLRGRAISIATCVNWGANIVVSLTFLNLLNTMGIGYTFIMYGCISILALIFMVFCVPETKNRSLEQINCELTNGFMKIKSLKQVLSYCKCCSS